MFDFVVVGAGSAGCVLAARLSEAGRRVCLIEAGGPQHRTFNVRAPGMYYMLWKTPLDWAFSTEPQLHCDGRRHFWPRGKVLGGTSCLNANVYIRGNRANYDAWGDGWRYADVLPLFKRSEDNGRGASEYHGAGGPLAVDDNVVPPIGQAFVEATAAHCKVAVNPDFNGAEQEGAGPYQLTVRKGHRASTATAFLDPARKRANLEVITKAVVSELVVDGDRVTGVRLESGQVIEGREVIVAAGAIGSPQLLLRSGIGPGDELREAGVDPRHELPLVGKHLQDHLLAAVVYESPSTRNLSIPSMLWWTLQHRMGGKGVLGQAPVPVGAFVKSRAQEPIPDVQFHFSPFGVNLPTDAGFKPKFGRFTSLLPGLIYPRSHGEVTLRGIDPKYFADAADLDHLVAGVKLAREIAATGPLAGMLGPEVFPGPAVQSDDDLRANIRATCNTIFHPAGTCGIGRVVDPDLRVRGLRGVRIADASVMPEIIGGNTNAPTIMIAEKCAELALAN